ncbi:hypothetical protein OPW36_21015 [Vibrio europaeus]|uniref:Uncharacterized protein n=1 Tax=Vibrio europaeus TaxID=300876 RepID=A0A178JFK5_9VIBR|nr:hypothetical protein [Vibrio europaeus]MDC5706399.1 hypothetical protein [Vibrio europaeus]MDC5711714.1 hypothetical protein [Vibrio europaeus]MDC5716189.1 hypothetical protein [Vibrio europaeus]MDC5723184.1 hypothetical protein [Vibrio europaeus]MDC5728419.1 hypothetical protein [Vibrio europaeus]
MRFAINFLLGVLLLMTLMLSVPSHAQQCEFGFKPDGTCRNVCEFLHAKAGARTMSWDAYIWGQDPKAACIGDGLENRCAMSIAGSQACTGIGEDGSTIVGTRCTGKWKFTGQICNGPDFSGGTVPTPPEPKPDPTPPPIPDNDHTSIPIISVVGFGTLGAQIAGGDNAINNQIRRGWERLSSVAYAGLTQDQKQHEQTRKDAVQIGSTLSMMTNSISNLNTFISTQKQTPWTKETLKELIDGIKVISDCVKGTDNNNGSGDGSNGSNNSGGSTNATKPACAGLSGGGSGNSSGGGSGGGFDDTNIVNKLSSIEEASFMNGGSLFRGFNNLGMGIGELRESINKIKKSGKTFKAPEKPTFKTPFKDGVEGLKTEIEQLEKDIEEKLTKSPLKMGTMHFNGGSYRGTQFDLDHHGHRISVGFNFLDRIAPHIDLIKGVIIFLATLMAAIIVLSSGRNS